MAEPTFVKLIDVSSSLEDNSITATLGTGDGRAAKIDMSGPCAGAVFAALAAESGRLNAQLPADQRDIKQTLTASVCQLAMGEFGSAVLVIELANGAEIALEFETESLHGLAAELYALTAQSDRPH